MPTPADKLKYKERILVENFFGRLKMLFKITREKYRGKLEHFDVFLDCCLGLANFHISSHPLRVDDWNYMNKIKENIQETKRSIEAQKRRDAMHRRSNSLQSAQNFQAE